MYIQGKLSYFSRLAGKRDDKSYPPLGEKLINNRLTRVKEERDTCQLRARTDVFFNNSFRSAFIALYPCPRGETITLLAFNLPPSSTIYNEAKFRGDNIYLACEL